MKWFKHMTAASSDEKLSVMIDAHGLEGYGFWWILLEQIAAQMDGGNDKCSATYPLKKWASSCEVSTRKYQKFVKTLSELSLVSIKKDQNLITVECPNLLKIRDEYQMKKKKNPDNNRTNSGQTPDAFASASVSASSSPSNEYNIKHINEETPFDWALNIDPETGEVC